MMLESEESSLIALRSLGDMFCRPGVLILHLIRSELIWAM